MSTLFVSVVLPRLTTIIVYLTHCSQQVVVIGNPKACEIHIVGVSIRRTTYGRLHLWITKLVCNEWSISNEKIAKVVSDDAANTTKAIDLSFGKKRHINCFAHQLNLIADRSTDIVPDCCKRCIFSLIYAILGLRYYTDGVFSLRSALSSGLGGAVS